MNLLKYTFFKYFMIVIAILGIGIGGYYIFSMIGKGNNKIGITENGYRIDKEPIINRFPKLGNFEKCYWKTGIVGNVGIGPTRYWMKGFVILNKNEFEKFKKEYKWSIVEPAWNPSLDTDILKIQSFRWAFNKEFNDYIKTSTYVGNIYFDLKNGIVFFDIQV